MEGRRSKARLRQLSVPKPSLVGGMSLGYFSSSSLAAFNKTAMSGELGLGGQKGICLIATLLLLKSLLLETSSICSVCHVSPCMCVYVDMFASVGTLALELRRMETEWT